MAKAMQVEDMQNEAVDADAGASISGIISGAFARLKVLVSARIGAGFDAVIGALQRKRAKFAPAVAAEAAAAEPAVPEKVVGHVILRKTLVGLLLLLAGATCGGVFAFNMFAHKIERQGELIVNQADEVFEYRTDAERAEDARDKAREQLREANRELAELRQSHDEMKARLAEAEGRMLMYGNGQGPAARADTRSQRAPAKSGAQARGAGVSSGECELNSASAGSDLSRCLSMTR